MIDGSVTIQMVSALKNRYEAERSAAVAELMIFMRNPVGVGDHSTVIDTVDDIMERIASAEGKLGAVSRYFTVDEVEQD